ncbi:MAG: hypothetical protein ACXVCY_06490 [Pseudobdellovibrionaceae bacterium]
MKRVYLSYLGIAFITGISLWLLRVNNKEISAQPVATQSTKEPALETKAQLKKNGDFKIITPENAKEFSRLVFEQNSLNQRLTVEKQKLEKQKQDLDTLRSQSQEKDLAPYSSQIQAENDQLRELAMELRGYENLEKDINRRADEVLKDQNSQSQVVKDGLDEGIRNQETLIKQTEEQVNFWQFNNNYTTEQQARLAEEQTLLNTQKQQLQDLRQQRLAVSEQVLTNTRQVQSEEEQELMNLSQERIDLQNEILTLNTELAQLQQQQSEQRASQMSLSSKIQQEEKAYEQQQQQVRTLEASLRQKQAEINNLY